VKERGIIMQAESVRAILAGRKTQTRRIVSLFEAGQHLWVREAWRMPADLDKMAPFEAVAACRAAGYETPWLPVRYEADGSHRDWWGCVEAEHGRYRNALHMPRCASRITLEVTEAREEQLHDISEDDAIAEGYETDLTSDPPMWHCVDAYARAWDDINGKRAPWSSNPLVRVASFRVLP